MNDVLLKSLEQAPSLALTTVLVVYFLRYLRSLTADFQQVLAKMAMDMQGSEQRHCNEVRSMTDRAVEALEGSIEQQAISNQTLERSNKILDKLEKKIPALNRD